MPHNLLPIAADEVGNAICISWRGEDKDSIYIWEHEADIDVGEVPTYENVHLLAENLDEFLDKFYELKS